MKQVLFAIPLALLINCGSLASAHDGEHYGMEHHPYNSTTAPGYAWQSPGSPKWFRPGYGYADPGQLHRIRSYGALNPYQSEYSFGIRTRIPISEPYRRDLTTWFRNDWTHRYWTNNYGVWGPWYLPGSPTNTIARPFSW